MRTIQVYASTGYVGASKTDTFEVEDNATDEEINEIAEEYMHEMVDSGWCEVEKEGCKNEKV